MTADDKSYFVERARRERKIASTCEDNSVAMIHLRLADEYDKIADGDARGLQAARDQ